MVKAKKSQTPVGPSLSRDERRQQLIEAAIRAFGRKGYFRTQVSDIIAEADVARGTFYLYFKGKREVFDSVMTRLFEDIEKEVRRLPREAVNQIPAQLKGNIERVTHVLMDNPWIIKLLFSESLGVDQNLDSRLRQFYEKILDLIGRGLRQGQEMGFVRAGDLKVLSVSLLGALKEVFYQDFLGTAKVQRQTVIDELFKMVVQLIAAPNIPVAIRQAINI